MKTKGWIQLIEEFKENPTYIKPLTVEEFDELLNELESKTSEEHTIFTWEDRQKLINQAQKDFAEGKITEFPVIELPNYPPPYSRCEFRFQWVEELGRCSVPNCPHCNGVY